MVQGLGFRAKFNTCLQTLVSSGLGQSWRHLLANKSKKLQG